MKATIVKTKNRSWLIQTGMDNGDTILFGNKIIWQPIAHRPGLGPDGVYFGQRTFGGENDAFIVIHNERIVFIDEIIQDIDHTSQHHCLEKSFPKSTPDRGNWTDVAWKAKGERKAAVLAAYRKKL